VGVESDIGHAQCARLGAFLKACCPVASELVAVRLNSRTATIVAILHSHSNLLPRVDVERDRPLVAIEQYTLGLSSPELL
jgi:hypothetical protein